MNNELTNATEEQLKEDTIKSGKIIGLALLTVLTTFLIPILFVFILRGL